ncbi:MAG TPA: peptidoglycan-binding protein [Solirubrobacteraceae bacterium]|nr:peptidoglycan-binding protein [Solirubrobacteraceae bacterium]
MLCCGAVAVPAAVAKRQNPTPLGDRALRAGAVGTDVRELQKALRKAGFSVKVDGRFGPSTVRAVKRFQRAANLTASGTVGRKTIAALEAAAQGGSAGVTGGVSRSTATKSRASLGRRIPVKRGMRGHDIRVLQDLLGNAGFDVNVDGVFGSRTLDAVKAFEQRSGRSVDGMMDGGDIEALRTAAAAGPPPDPAATRVAAPAGPKATIGPDGLAVAPAGAPPQVQQIIAAGNEIASKPYKYGGGHGKWNDSGYDCSGSVSYALHGAGLLDQALPSSGFVNWGEPGPGQWVTIYAHGGHMYMVVAGLRFDTSGRSKNNTRWQTQMRSTAGYTVRHPPGL